MEKKDFVLATLLQLTQVDIDDYKQCIGRCVARVHHMRSLQI
jgi:hypothetical protein